MDQHIDARFERVEKALATLVESITKYTPQSLQASELSHADAELGAGLRDLEVHQNNHARLAQLQATSDALDAQIRDTIRLLWTTRRDITATAVTSFPAGPRYDVNWEELLGYARRISRTTLPAPSILAAANAAAANTTATTTTTTTSAVNTPAAQTPATPGLAVNGVQQQHTFNGTALPDEWTRFLDPLTNTTFYPWPTEDKIRIGALASIQSLIDQGVDPRAFDPAEEEARRQREEEERRVQEEREATEREENLRRMREEQARIARERQRERERALEEAMRRGSTGAGPAQTSSGATGGASGAGEPAKKQFQFMDLDDDDDD